jgi:hypothetical protein
MRKRWTTGWKGKKVGLLDRCLEQDVSVRCRESLERVSSSYSCLSRLMIYIVHTKILIQRVRSGQKLIESASSSDVRRTESRNTRLDGPIGQTVRLDT